MCTFDRGMAYAELLQARNEYREYKEAHWDHERNHIKPEYAEGLYKLFRKGRIAREDWDKIERQRVKQMQPQQPQVIETQLNFL